MARKKAGESKVEVGNIRDVSGEINIAAGDIYKGYTAEQVSVLIQQITTTFEPKKFAGRSPYKGLDNFEEKDAELFFGREKLVADLISRVKHSRTVFITGPSGSGKSSLVRAGLIPTLKNGALPNSDCWLYATMKPGRDPFEALGNAFSRLKSPELGDYFQQNASKLEILHKCTEAVLTERSDERLVLFIDQFEEVFTQLSPDKAEMFIQLLDFAATTENGRAIILFAMRSDFLSNCATYPKLNALLNQQFVQIGAMQPDELVNAIAQPALRVGLNIDPDLIAQIIDEMQGEPGTLPLMQFALKDLFDAGQQAQSGIITLTLNDYLQRGGIHKALEHHADDSFAKLDKHEQELARFVFSGLIEIGRGTQDTRRTAIIDELILASVSLESVKAVVQKLADARLVITDEVASKVTVTLSHEKLIDAWPWLRRLINENRESIILQNEIAEDATEWNKHERDASYLYTGTRLNLTLENISAKNLHLPEIAQLFIETSHEAHNEELKLSRTRVKEAKQKALYGRMAFLAVLIAISAISLAAFAQNRISKQAQVSIANQLSAKAESISSTRNSKKMLADLLAIQSIKMFPSNEASQVLLNSNPNVRSVFLVNHSSRVNSVAFSPNGKYIVSISNDGSARVSEVLTGKEIVQKTFPGPVYAVAWSHNGKYIVSGECEVDPSTKKCDKGSARVWEGTTGKEVAHMLYDEWVLSVAFSPDDKYVVSGSFDDTARVWESTTGKEISRLNHNDGVSSVAFSPDGKYVVSGSYDDTARVWEATTGKEIAKTFHENSVNSVAFSPDGKYVVSGSDDGTAIVWEALTGKEIARMTHTHHVTSVAFSADGKYIVSGSLDGTARVWETTTGKEISRQTHDDAVNSVAFSPDGKFVISGSYDTTARLWEATTGREIARMTHDGAVNTVAFSPDGKYVVSGSEDGAVHVWNNSPSIETPFTPGVNVYSIEFSPDGKNIVFGGCDSVYSFDSGYCDQGFARVWDVKTGAEIFHTTFDDIFWSVAFSPNNKYIALANNDNSASIVDAQTGKEITQIGFEGGRQPVSVVFDPSGNTFVTGTKDGSVRLWESSTGKEISIGIPSLDSRVYSVAFSPDGKDIASGSADGTAHVWEIASGKEISHMKHDGSVRSVAFSPNGKYIVSGSDDRTVRVWDAMTGKEIARMIHDDWVRSVAFSPDGNYIVSGSDDETARIWEISTGNEVVRVNFNGGVEAVAFSPDGKYIASGSGLGEFRVWAWQPKDLIDIACNVMPRNLTRTEWDLYLGKALPYQAVCPNLPIEPETTSTGTVSMSPTP